MPKITPETAEEGDVITKESITSTTTEFERIDFDIDADNIREEGLDRRSFESQLFTTNPFKSVKANGAFGDDTLLERTKTWQRVEFRPEQMSNSDLSRYPQISIPWDPEKDTHCMIRCSMQITSRRDFSGLGIREGDFWDFGLVIVPPGVELPGAGTTDSYMTGLGAWPYQRVQLASAFNQDCNFGHLNFSESFSSGTAETELRDAVADVTPKVKTIKWIDEDTYFDNQPKGEWFQYGYNRYGNWTQSFTLIAQASSLVRRGFDLQPNISRWTQSGTAKVFVVYRCNLLDPGAVLYARESVTKENKARACVEGLELNYLKYRR